MTHSQLFLRRFKAALAFAFAICWISAFAQYPNAPNKIGLGRQTTGDGLVFRTSGKPVYTPTTAFNAWMALDTTTGNLWTYRGGEWFLEVAGDLRLVYPVVINKSGVDIKQGQVVMVDTVQLVQGDQVRVRPAIATVSNSQLIMGVASTDINNDATGYVSWFGYVREVDHADIAQTGVTLDVGDILYISATEAGRYTDTEPAAPNVNSTMALVVRKPSANNMTLLVRPWLNEKLGDLRDVDLAGLQTGDGIKWDGTKWVAGQFAGADSTVVSAGYGIDVSEVNNDFTVSADTNEIATPYDVSLKQDKLTGTGLVKSTSGTISYITDNSTNWDAAYNDRITSAAFSGSGTKTLTLTQQDAGTITASFTDLQGVTSVTAGTGLSGGAITTTGTISADTSVLSTKWFAADTASGVRDWVVNENYLRHNLADINRLLYSTDSGGDTIASVTNLIYNHYPVKLGIGVNPTAALDISGDVRISDLSTHTPTKLVGADADGDLGDLIIGNGLTVSGDSLIASGGSGTVTSIATNNGITGGTITTTGTIGLTGQALALHNLATNGLIARTGAGTVAGRTITAGTGISVTNGDGVSANPTITNSAPDQTVVLTAGTGISTSGTYPNFTITNSAPDQTVSIAAGTGISTSGSYPNFTITNSAPDQTVSITGAGINAVTGTYPNFTITGTEVDGSTTNELQNLSLSGQSLGITSGTGVTLPIIDVSAGSGISVTKASGNATISATDASVSNEGTLGVGAGGANTAVITSNTSAANGVTIAGGSNIAITESTSSNGGTVTIAATGLASSYIVQTRGETPSFGAGTPVQNSIVNFTDTLNFVFFGLQAAEVYTETSTNKTSIIGEFRNLYNSSESLTGNRTISTAGHKLTISGSNTAQVLEINNTNTGTTTNALTLQSFGSPLQATRLTSVTGSIVPVSDYYVNTSGTAAAGLGGFHRFYIEDAGGLNKEAGRIGFRTSDAAGNSYDSEAFISVRKDSSELKEGLTLLSTGQLQLKEYGDTLFTGTAVKYLAVDDDGKVIEVDGAAGTVKGTGAANKVAIWASADSLYQNSNLHWDEANGRLGINNTSPSERLHVGGNVLSERLIINTSGQSTSITNYKPTHAIGENFFIGGGGLNSLSHPDTTILGSFNTGIGLNSLFSNTQGLSNTALGGYALFSNTRGSLNVAIGGSSLSFNTTGNENLAIAGNSMFNNLTGSQNIGLGTYSLFTNTSGSYNTAIGTYGLYGNTTGSTNIAIGAFSLFSNTTATKNIGIGQGALFYNTTGSNLVAIGADAGNLTNTGTNNVTSGNSVYIGQDARPSASGNTNEIVIGFLGRGQGSNTAIIGNSSITNTYLRGKVSINTTASANTLDIEGGAAIGATYSGTNTAPTNGLLVEGETYIGKTTDAGAYNLQVSGAILTDSITISHSAQTAKISNFYPSGANGNNLFIGNNGGAALNSTSVFSSNNIGIGFNTLNNATSGYQNTMLGSGSGQELTTGLSNTAAGFEALKNVSTGQQNTGIGDKALTSITTGSYNTAVGSGANDGTTTASNNTSLGWFALTTIISGNDNTAVGYQAGRYSNSGSNLVTNSNSTFIGSDARSGSTSATNEIVIGYQSRGNGSNTTTIGNSSTTRTHIAGTLVAGRGAPITRTTSTYDMTNLPAVNYVIANFAGTMTITLPAAADWTGRELTIKTITANTVVSNATNVVPIDSATAGTAILPATDGAWALLVSDGTNWIIMQKG